MSDNFAFLKKYDEELYLNVHNAEALLKIDYVQAGDQLRSKVLEYFVNKLISDYNLKNEIKSFCESKGSHFNPDTLSSKLRFFTDVKAVNNVRNEPQRKTLKPIVCKHKKSYNDGLVNYYVSQTYISVNGEKKDRRVEPDDKYINTFHFIRAACNACHHDSKDKENLVYTLTYENILECFRIIYHIFACYFDDEAKNRKYNENQIPLGDYEIIRSFVPGDSERTGCIIEHEAKKNDENGFVKWAIIREYKKKEIDKNFLSRGYHTSIIAEYQLVDIPEAMIKVNNVTKFDDTKSPYYIVAYDFTREPHKLKDVISEIDLKNRYEICIRIAQCFEKLHGLPKPIYHRMLNHNCIYVQDCNDVNRGWVASVIKFDFSKITSQQTVFENYRKASEKTSVAEKKYLAPEWITDNKAAEWSKVDIFALGILFYDVLCGEISDCKPNGQALKQAGIDSGVIELIGKMITHMASRRPDIKEITTALKNVIQ